MRCYKISGTVAVHYPGANTQRGCNGLRTSGTGFHWPLMCCCTPRRWQCFELTKEPALITRMTCSTVYPWHSCACVRMASVASSRAPADLAVYGASRTTATSTVSRFLPMEGYKKYLIFLCSFSASIFRLRLLRMSLLGHVILSVYAV